MIRFLFGTVLCEGCFRAKLYDRGCYFIFYSRGLLLLTTTQIVKHLKEVVPRFAILRTSFATNSGLRYSQIKYDT